MSPIIFYQNLSKIKMVEIKCLARIHQKNFGGKIINSTQKEREFFCEFIDKFFGGKIWLPCGVTMGTSFDF